MDFRNCPCECEPKHKWTINIIDRHTKFVNFHTIHNKLADKGLNEVQKNCVTYGYPTTLPQKKLLHGAARTPRTQGLVKRSNRTFKKTMRTLIMTTCGLQISQWCKYTMQSSCIMNMSYHRAINMTPYEAVFHIKAKW